MADPEALEELLDHKIQPVPAVAATRTTIVLSTGKESHGVPVEILGSEDADRPSDAA